ncbi:MAG: M3 family metallopeptidase [Lautropia sp.]|nr:M3 family metallopeptidase [Lautropia sp.]
MTLNHLTLAGAIALAFSLSACSDSDTTNPMARTSDTQNTATPQDGGNAQLPSNTRNETPANVANNPLLKASTLPFEAPDFRTIKAEHFQPAIEEGMKQQLAEISAITGNSEAPTVSNTLEALERSGELLSRARGIFSNLVGTDTNDTLRAAQTALAPKLAAHADAIRLDPKLFARIKALYDARATAGHDAETLRLLEVSYRDFVLAGAELSDADKQKVRSLNEQLASLSTSFQQSLLKQTAAASVIVDDVKQLDGLSAGAIASAAEAAKAAGHEGKWLLRITNTTRQPVLASLSNRALRQRVWEASARRGLEAGDGDTRKLILDMTRLRAERAALLGYPNHAAYSLVTQMAGTPDAAIRMLKDMVPDALANARREADELKAAIRADGHDFELHPWDWEHYAEKVRATKHDFDPESVKPYFELNRVLKDGVFYALNRFYGISFRQRTDLPVYHPDVQVFDVLDADGSQLGLFYADYYARPSKRGGAWMSSFRIQSELLNRKPVVINVMNIAKPAAGQPTLLSFDEVTTMFHEIGHGIHGLFSRVRYPSLAGTAVSRDYVEFPSQFEEDWNQHPEILANYARHHQTGEPIPNELMQKMLGANRFNEGFDTLEYLSAALLDLEWHTQAASSQVDDVEAFEKAALAKHGVDYAPVPPRYRSGFFQHIFSGGYAASYYAYIWAEVLAADAFAHVQQQGGLKRELGNQYRQQILSRGNTQDTMTMYEAWRGAKPDPQHLLRRRGLATTAAN